MDRNARCHCWGLNEKVALRKESVDRNIPSHWITSRTGVALRKESVDRNLVVALLAVGRAGRSPQGERG